MDKESSKYDAIKSNIEQQAVEQYKKGLLEWLNKLEEVGEEKRLKAIIRNDTENKKFWEGRTYGYTHTKEKVIGKLFDKAVE